jgi:hypothetical protein
MPRRFVTIRRRITTIYNVLCPLRATVSSNRRGICVVTPDGEVIAMKILDVDGTRDDVDGTRDDVDGTQVEPDFTGIA